MKIAIQTNLFYFIYFDRKHPLIKKKSENEGLLDTCVYYDLSQKNLYDKGIKNYDLLQYILCVTSHLSTFTLNSFSPTYLFKS